MIEYGIALEGTSGGAVGGGFSGWNLPYWADSVVRDPMSLMIAGAIFLLILLVLFAR